MEIHENVILDLLPAVRSGHASSESRALVDDYLRRHPALAQVASMQPVPDPALEMRALELTRRRVGRTGWLKGLAIFFTLLPLSIKGGDDDPVHFIFADMPSLQVAMWMLAIVFWVVLAVRGRRMNPLR